MIFYHNPNDFWAANDYGQYRGLDDDDRMRIGCLQLSSCIIMLMIGIAVCALFGSCKSVEYVVVPQTHTDTMVVTKLHRDSVFLHDSTYVEVKGDSVKIEHWNTKYVEKQVHDTTYISKTDTIPQPYPVVKEVPAELTWWQRVMMTIGGLFIVVIVMMVVSMARR